MKKIALGATGKQVSALCLGTMYFGSKVDESTSFAILDEYDGADEVITIKGGMLRVYGGKFAKRSDTVVRHDPEYLKNHVANHTHY